MPYKDPEKQKEYQREWQRQRRAGETVGFKVLRVSSTEQVKTAQGLPNLLEFRVLCPLTPSACDLALREAMSKHRWRFTPQCPALVFVRVHSSEGELVVANYGWLANLVMDTIVRARWVARDKIANPCLEIERCRSHDEGVTVGILACLPDLKVSPNTEILTYMTWRCSSIDSCEDCAIGKRRCQQAFDQLSPERRW